jgi:cytochrome c oxidase subunit II
MLMEIKRLVRCGGSLLFFLLGSACSPVSLSPNRTPSTLDPQGPGAARLAEHWWLMFALGTAIYLLVLVLLFAAILRRRRATSDTPPDSAGGDTGRSWPIWGGILLPLVVIGITFGHSIFTLAAVESPQEHDYLKVRVVARRWWWEVHYPAQGVTTANEIHLPVGQPVQVQLESADVIHSFWIPELHGKMDLIPTRINHITIQADEAGLYRGECAEFCGLQHAHMGFMVVAESEEEFNNWLAAQQQPAPVPGDALAAAGQQVFISANCIFCHSVKGLEDKPIDRSAVDLGPDLTHLASRQTIAAGSLTQNRGNLAGWIVDAQHVKPGSLMPNQYLNSQDLQALIAYLESLH